MVILTPICHCFDTVRRPVAFVGSRSACSFAAGLSGVRGLSRVCLSLVRELMRRVTSLSVRFGASPLARACELKLARCSFTRFRRYCVGRSYNVRRYSGADADACDRRERDRSHSPCELVSSPRATRVIERRTYT